MARSRDLHLGVAVGEIVAARSVRSFFMVGFFISAVVLTGMGLAARFSSAEAQGKAIPASLR